MSATLNMRVALVLYVFAISMELLGPNAFGSSSRKRMLCGEI